MLLPTSEVMSTTQLLLVLIPRHVLQHLSVVGQSSNSVQPGCNGVLTGLHNNEVLVVIELAGKGT